MTDLITTDRNLITFTPEQVDLIKRNFAKGATDDELQLFLYQAQKMGLDPIARQIYFRKHRNRKSGEETVSILTAIDGYRLTADRTGKYCGSDEPFYDDEERPRRATVTVYKLVGGLRCPFTASARWDQYYPGDHQGFMWNKMPHLMLGKCAEALALRKAFPAELSGVYVKEEMDQVVREADFIDAEAKSLPAGDKSSWQSEKQDKSQAQAGAIAAAERAAKAFPKPTAPSIYDNGDTDMQKKLANILKSQKVDEALWEAVGTKLHGRPSTDLKAVIEEVSHA